MQTADVLIVGASVAGLHAAGAAARGGASVLLLETKAELGVPEAPAQLAFDFLWTASEHPPASTVRRRLAGVRLRSPTNAAHAIEVDAPLSLLRRTAYDHHVARVARAAGARILTGVPTLHAMPDRTLVSADGESYRGKVLVFSDGAATLARAYLTPTRDPDALAWGVSQEFEHAGSSEETRVTLTPGSHAPGGRSQLNPLDGDRWSHWTFYRGPRSEAAQRARAALAVDASLQGWGSGVIEKARLTGVSGDPVYTLPHELATDGVMVVGGAAGQGGLEVGAASGELAGDIAARCALAGTTRRRDLLVYERTWKRTYQSGYKALRKAADRLGRLDDARLDKLLEPWNGWRVPARDIVGLGHPSFTRRAEAAAKFIARNPWAMPGAALAGLRSLR